MTSIRGRRVHRLILREFAGFDSVTRVGDALVALEADGREAMLRTDGRGPAYTIVETKPGGKQSTTAYDALKDSLPIVG